MAGGEVTSLDDINAYLRAELPLTLAMGLRVTKWEGIHGDGVELAAPLEPNLNHTDTAFGGSIATMGILAGYTLLYLCLRDRGISNRLLIQRSEVDFLRPISTDLTARARRPEGDAMDVFMDSVTRRRKGRITIESGIYAGPMLAARHIGVYIAILY